MTEDPFKAIRSFIDEITAAELLNTIQDEHRRKYVKIMVHPTQYEPVRQAICNIDPLMESAVTSNPRVQEGAVLFMDTSILEIDA